MIALQLGVVVEVPDPKIAIVGRVEGAGAAGHRTSPSSRSRSNFVGSVDFGQRFVRFRWRASSIRASSVHDGRRHGRAGCAGAPAPRSPSRWAASTRSTSRLPTCRSRRCVAWRSTCCPPPTTRGCASSRTTPSRRTRCSMARAWTCTRRPRDSASAATSATTWSRSWRRSFHGPASAPRWP